MAHILIYNINEPYVHQGGMERVTDTLIRQLLRLGHKVSLLCRYRNRAKALYDSPCPLYFLPGKETDAVFYNDLLEQLQPDIIIDQEEGGIIGPHGIFRRSGEVHRRRTSYIAVLHSSAVSAIRHYKHTKHRKIPNAFLSGLYHGVWLTLLRYRARLLKRRDYSQLLREYDCIVTLSEAAIGEFATLCPTEGRLHAIPNCSLYPRLNSVPTKHHRLLYVGRMDNTSKRVDRLLRIWARLQHRFPKWELILLGNGADLEVNQQLAAELQLERCRFHGCCEPTEFYRSADFICLTSNFEGFGMALLEGMQHGCIPVAFDSYPAVRDLIQPGINGLLVAPFQEDSYAQQLAELMQDSNRRRHMQQKALEHTLRFSPENIAAQWDKLINQLTTEKRHDSTSHH